MSDTNLLQRILDGQDSERREQASMATRQAEMHTDIKHILIRMDKQDARLDRHDMRLGTLEAFRWKIIGLSLASPVVLSGGIQILKSILPT